MRLLPAAAAITLRCCRDSAAFERRFASRHYAAAMPARALTALPALSVCFFAAPHCLQRRCRLEREPVACCLRDAGIDDCRAFASRVLPPPYFLRCHFRQRTPDVFRLFATALSTPLRQLSPLISRHCHAMPFLFVVPLLSFVSLFASHFLSLHHTPLLRRPQP